VIDFSGSLFLLLAIQTHTLTFPNPSLYPIKFSEEIIMTTPKVGLIGVGGIVRTRMPG